MTEKAVPPYNRKEEKTSANLNSAKSRGACIRACTGFDGGLEVGEAIRSGELR